MPNDLERAFATLAADADHTRTTPATEIRRAADRRALHRSIAGVAVVALAVTGIAVGATFALADGPDHTPVTPAHTATVTPSVPASPTPAPSTRTSPPLPLTSTSVPAPPPPSIPKSIPASAFLRASDVLDGDAPIRGDAPELPSFCGQKFPSAGQRGIRAAVKILYHSRGSAPDTVPAGTVDETITVYRGNGADRFMSELRTAVKSCRQQKIGTLTWQYRSLGTAGAGAESLVIDLSTPSYSEDGEPVNDGSRQHQYLGAVRIGDTVALIDHRGWENFSADHDDTVTFVRNAAKRLSAWRS
jgi:hypothetical protein